MFFGRGFTDLGELILQLDEHGSPLEFEPQGRYKNASTSKLHRYGAGTFCKFKVNGLPVRSGVYVFLVEGIAKYVGKAVRLKERFAMGHGNISPKNCFVGGQQTNCRLNQLILNTAKKGHSIRVLVHECSDQDSFESDLIADLSPDWNRTK